MKPYSENIIFWDTEFSSLDPYKGELLSIGLVKPSGEELYMELEFDGDVHPWVEQNVMPYLTGEKISRNMMVTKLTNFIGNKKPWMVAHVNFFDVIYLYKIIGVKDDTKDFPFHWIHVDFASVLFGLGIDPQRFSSKNPKSLLTEYGIDPSVYREHHALDDAKLLRDVYLKMTAG